MVETIRGEVIHAVAPDELDDYDLQPAVRELAEGRYVLVCRAGGAPSWLDRLVAFVRRDPIEAVTVVADEPAAEGEEIVVSAEETDVPGVYDAVSRR